MSNVSNGVVEAVRKDSKGLMIAGNWYSSYNGFNDISKGDVISFNFDVKGQWKNIKGPIEKVTGVAVGDATASSTETMAPQAQDLPAHYMIARGYMNKVQTFPVAFDHPDRAIIRQNSLTNAVNLITGVCHKDILISSEVENSIAQTAIRVAGIFEKYSTGQLEMEAAIAEVAAMTTDPSE